MARNGQRFLTGLSEREAKNSQFDFMKPQHNLFGYFTYLVESYSKCLLPKKEDQIKLQNFVVDKNFILRRATDRYLWEKKYKENQKNKDKVDEIERSQMAQIDWNEFIVVDVVEFTEEELNNTVPITSNNQNVNLNVTSFSGNVNILLKNPQNVITEIYSSNNNNNIPSKININETEINNVNNVNGIITKENDDNNDIAILDENEVINNSKKLLGLAAFEKDNNNRNEKIIKTNSANIEESLSKEDEKAKENINEIYDNKNIQNNQTTEKSVPEPGMKIVTNYKRKTESKNTKKIDYQKCPLCNENIPTDEISQHMRIELLDPKWKEINKEIKERKLEVSVAPTSDFINYLGDFAKDRPDLFGDDVNDIIRVEEWKKVEKKFTNQNIKFDGFAPNMSRTTANIAMLAQQTKKNYEESRKIDKNEIISSNNSTGININTGKENPESNKINFAQNAQNNSTGNPVALSVTQQGAILNNSSKGSITSNTFITQNNKLICNDNSDNIGKKLLENMIPEDIWMKKYPVNLLFFLFLLIILN